MKKNLFSICMLFLCTCFISSKTFAQDDSGGSYNGSEPTIDGGGTTITTFQAAPPSGVKNVKRNNGNASSVYGVAEARLSFTNAGQMTTAIKLEKVTTIDGTVVDAVSTFPAVIEKGYISYSLKKNVDPAKKLMFYFSAPTGNFAIPETN